MKRSLAALLIILTLIPVPALADGELPTTVPEDIAAPTTEPETSPLPSPSPEPSPLPECVITPSEIAEGLAYCAANPVSLKLDGVPLVLESEVCPPTIFRGSTVVPVRGVLEALGATVDWEDATHSVTVTRGETVIDLALESDAVTVNGVPQTLEFAVPAVDHDGDGYVTTLLPLRFICETLGLFVDWDDPTRTVLIYTVKPPEPEFDLSAWNLILVNRWNPLPANFSVQLGFDWTGRYADARVTDDLNAMMTDCKNAGLQPYIASAYRTYYTQQTLYNNRVQRYMNDTGCTYEEALYGASLWVAAPDTSEHQTGLAFDIVSYTQPAMNSTQESTPEQQWLMAHSWEYGFILRYPTDKSAITGVNYEPWHYRYVGREAAKSIYSSGLCFEEWLAEQKG